MVEVIRHMLNCHKICKRKLAKSDATHKHDHDYGNHGIFVNITKTFKITHFVSCMTQEIISYHFWKILFQLINFTQCYSFLAHKSTRNWLLSSPWLDIFLFSHWIFTDYAQFDLPYQFLTSQPIYDTFKSDLKWWQSEKSEFWCQFYHGECQSQKNLKFALKCANLPVLKITPSVKFSEQV